MLQQIGGNPDPDLLPIMRANLWLLSHSDRSIPFDFPIKIPRQTTSDGRQRSGRPRFAPLSRLGPRNTGTSTV